MKNGPRKESLPSPIVVADSARLEHGRRAWIAERLFRALASRGINVIIISQASSEHTICFGVSQADAPAAIAAVQQEFRFELQHQLTSIEEKPNQAIVAVVGEGMKGQPGCVRQNLRRAWPEQHQHQRDRAGRVGTQHLLRRRRDTADARAQCHPSGVFRSAQTLALVVIGVGNIGSTLLQQLHEQRLSAGAWIRHQRRRHREQQAFRPCGWRNQSGALARDSFPRRDDAWIPRALAGEIAKLRADECSAGRLHGRRDRRGCLSGVRERQPAHHHAEQARERPTMAAIRGADGSAAQAAEIFSRRSKCRRRIAHHVDAARFNRERRCD